MLSTPPYQQIKNQVFQALSEDIGSGDLTASLITSNSLLKAQLICREPAILCGQLWFNESFKQLSSHLEQETIIKWHAQDGDTITADQCICTIEGNAQVILSAERTAINFLQTLSATASVTAHYVSFLKNSATRLVDTRKTIPGLRIAQKYAVRCGGGYNHRLGLFDGILIKENHIMATGSITQAIKSARNNSPHTLKIEVEIETLIEMKEALDAKADIVLLDNMNNTMLDEAVSINKAHAHHAILEVSGNITQDRLKQLASIGVDYISTGAITKHIQAVDFSLRVFT